MRDWRLMLGGLGVWAVHFLAVYLVASLAAMARPEAAPVWTAAGLVLTVVDLIALACLARRTRTDPDVSAIAARVGLAGCGVAAIAVVWQTLPLILNRPG